MSRGLSARSVLLHGPGGCGKTYCLTEVVMKVVRHFCGERGVKAIAATNGGARLLHVDSTIGCTRGDCAVALDARLSPRDRAEVLRKTRTRRWLVATRGSNPEPNQTSANDS